LTNLEKNTFAGTTGEGFDIILVFGKSLHISMSLSLFSGEYENTSCFNGEFSTLFCKSGGCGLKPCVGDEFKNDSIEVSPSGPIYGLFAPLVGVSFSGDAIRLVCFEGVDSKGGFGYGDVIEDGIGGLRSNLPKGVPNCQEVGIFDGSNRFCFIGVSGVSL
jgi:hypothetical protein